MPARRSRRRCGVANRRVAPLHRGAVLRRAIEAARYLVPLLDAERDAAEIAHLRDRIKKLESVPRWITPIVIPFPPSRPRFGEQAATTALDLVDDDAPPQHHVGAAAVWQRPPPNCAAWRCGTTGTAMASASAARSVPSPRGASPRSRRPTTSTRRTRTRFPGRAPACGLWTARSGRRLTWW